MAGEKVVSPPISMYLGGSKYWWTYLALLSNSSLVKRMGDGAARAVFFDDVALLPRTEIEAVVPTCRYFYVFWDGLTHTDAALLRQAGDVLGSSAVLGALVVGDVSHRPDERFSVESLYAEGALRFNGVILQFDSRTRAIVKNARMKTRLMPLKNILQNENSRWPSLKLLFASRRVVFCGSYGTIPKMMQALCERRAIDYGLFEAYPYFCRDNDQSYGMYREYVGLDGVFLAGLYDRKAIDDTFFLSAVHLLGREFFVERIGAGGMKIFANGYATGININVYTTPFYAQHVFPDFGSVVGSGNYPRLADLAYFKKTTVPITLEGDIGQLSALARDGRLIEHFDQLWERYAPELRRRMS